MKERIALSKSVDIGGDLQATAFRPNYIYLFEDAVQVYFDPNHIPSMRIAYPNPETKESAGQVVMPQDVADNFKAALSAVLDLCKGRLEKPFVEPVKEAAAEDVRAQGGNK
jgi:hypothetical protein